MRFLLKLHEEGKIKLFLEDETRRVQVDFCKNKCQLLVAYGDGAISNEEPDLEGPS